MVEFENARAIAAKFVKKRKNIDINKVNVVVTEQKNGVWIIKGTCPIDLCGHPWRESFEIEIDQKGRIKASSFKLM